MDTPLEIVFHGLDKSEAVEARVREKVARLAKHFDRLTHCRVVIDATRRQTVKGMLYHVKIEIGVPSKPPIVVNTEPAQNVVQEDLLVTLREAFAAARRRLDDEAALIKGAAKIERGRRRPAG